VTPAVQKVDREIPAPFVPWTLLLLTEIGGWHRTTLASIAPQGDSIGVPGSLRIQTCGSSVSVVFNWLAALPTFGTM
jgi:hypothetical protein